MTDQALIGLITTLGPAGTSVVLVMVIVRYLHAQILAAKAEVATAQEKRVADAQAATAQLLSLAEAQHRQIELLTAAMNEATSASREMRGALESVAAERGLHRGFPSAPRRGA